MVTFALSPSFIPVTCTLSWPYSDLTAMSLSIPHYVYSTSSLFNIVTFIFPIFYLILLLTHIPYLCLFPTLLSCHFHFPISSSLNPLLFHLSHPHHSSTHPNATRLRLTSTWNTISHLPHNSTWPSPHPFLATSFTVKYLPRGGRGIIFHRPLPGKREAITCVDDAQ